MRSPLYDYYDPEGLLTEVIDPLTGERRKATLSDLLPEEEKRGMLRNLAEAGISGLQLAGYVLDSPGALVRGILAGKPLSVFGGINDRVTGRDLLRQYGMVGEKDTWGNFAAGLASEVLLDPLLYINPLAVLGKGSLTKTVGRPLRKAGLLRDSALDAARGFGMPRSAAFDDVSDLAASALPGQAAISGDTLQRIAGPDATARLANIAGTTTPQDAANKVLAAVPTPPRAPSGVREYLRNLTPRQAFAEARQRMLPDEYNEALQRFAAAGGDMNATTGAAGLTSFRVPGTGIQFDVTGGAFGDSVAKFLDSAGEWSKRAPVIGPISRAGAVALDSSVGYTLDPDVQMAHRQAFAQARINQERFRRQIGKLQRDALQVKLPETLQIGDAVVPVPERLKAGFRSQDLQNALADWLESQGSRAGNNAVSVPGSPQVTKTSGNAVADYLLENIPEFRAVRDAFASLPESARRAAQARGLNLPTWTSRLADTEFFPRQALWFAQDEYLPEQLVKGQKPYTRGQRLFSVADNFGRSRQVYTDIPGGRRTFRAMTAGPTARQLQDDLLKAERKDWPQIIDRWFDSQNIERPYQRLVSDAAVEAQPEAARVASKLKEQLAEFVTSLDRQYAGRGVGVFDTPVFTDALRYGMGQARVSAFTDQLIDQLNRAAVDVSAEFVRGGRSVPLAKAAEDLGFEPNRFAELWRASGRGDIAQFSVDRQTVDALKALAMPTRLGLPESQLLRGVDAFTRLFKVGALAWPSFHTRNFYSNMLSMLAGESSPSAMTQAYRASRGNLAPVAEYLKNAPVYKNLTPEARAAKFAEDAAAAGVGTGNVFDDVSGVPEQAFQRLTPGMSPENDIAAAARGLLGQRGRSWRQFFRDLGTIRGVGFSRPGIETRNPLLRVNEAVGNTIEDTTRLAMFADLLRKGYAPTEAGDIVRRFLIDYSPQAYSAVERDLLKRVIPFYSFQKGMFPAVADSLLYRPGNIQGQAVRAVSRASQPTEETFLPDRFRRSSAIPIPFGSSDGVQKLLTKLDAPWESTFNLLTPGAGGSLLGVLGDTVRETGSNVLGQMNPLIKAPLEYITDRQFYSGGKLSDAYSFLENANVPGGRSLEQIAYNFIPFGTRTLSLLRQLSDSRLTPLEKAVKIPINVFSGVGIADVQSDKAREKAAREMLKTALREARGVRTYENIVVDEESLARMTPDQRRKYLLYRIIQSDASRRARERKAQEMAAR